MFAVYLLGTLLTKDEYDLILNALKAQHYSFQICNDTENILLSQDLLSKIVNGCKLERFE